MLVMSAEEVHVGREAWHMGTQARVCPSPRALPH